MAGVRTASDTQLVNDRRHLCWSREKETLHQIDVKCSVFVRGITQFQTLCFLTAMENTHDTRSLPAVILHTIILVTTSLLSLTGNSLVCVAFYRNRRLRTITNFYVLSLAIADLMVAILLFPFGAIASGFRRWPFNFNFCQFAGFLAVYWGQVSTCTLALTSINRYFCVVKPQKYSVLSCGFPCSFRH